jgi:protein O-mannosyl-transferase
MRHLRYLGRRCGRWRLRRLRIQARPGFAGFGRTLRGHSASNFAATNGHCLLQQQWWIVILGKLCRETRNAMKKQRHPKREGPERPGPAQPRDSAPPAGPRPQQATGFVQSVVSGPGRWIAIGLTLITLIAYASLSKNGFVSWDDDYYITENSQVLRGLTWPGVVWAFTTGQGANWHPLTSLSHLLDVQLFGLNAGMHHSINLALHVLNTLLLFAFLRKTTGAVWRSAFVSALFAVHPLHVESVAWAAERKDVLSTFFWMLTLCAYAAYGERPKWTRYAAVVLLFALGLLSKPMVVTLPFALLLLDIWPLQRLGLGVRKLVTEKIPLFCLAAASSAITFVVQRQAGAVQQFETVGLDRRLQNVFVSYVSYLLKALWPASLAALYPFPSSIPTGEVVGAALALGLISVAVVLGIRSRPYLAVGWFWYLGTLVPVIGLIQVGYQGSADRYTYIPLIGIFVMAAWGLPDLADRWSFPRTVLAAAAGVTILLCVIATRSQVTYWKDGLSLWQHTVSVTNGNWIAHNNLGFDLAKAGRFDEAVAHYTESLRIFPNYMLARENLGLALASQRKFSEAIAQYREALQIQPTNARLRTNFGLALAGAGNPGEAIAQYTEALRLEPELSLAHNRLGNILVREGKFDEAITHYENAIHIDPNDAEARNNLGVAFASQGRLAEAVTQFAEAVRLKPDFADARNNLARAKQGAK